MGNVSNTEPGAIANLAYWVAGLFHFQVSANLVFLFYMVSVLVAFALVFVGLAGGKSAN